MSRIQAVLANKNAFALISGASSGLGAAFANHLVSLGKPVFLLALPDGKLPVLVEKLSAKASAPIEQLEIDLSAANALSLIQQRLAAKGIGIDFLINNAGIGGSKPFLSANWQELEAILQLNVLATARMCYELLPNLSQHKAAVILNVASMAALTPMPYKTVYPASKAFVSSLSLGLSAELGQQHPVGVYCLYPGGMLTNPDVSARLQKQSWIGQKTIVSPEVLVVKCLEALQHEKPQIIIGWANRLNAVLFRLLPWRLRAKALRKFMQQELELF
jgi:short-subunit dehydrogenase